MKESGGTPLIPSEYPDVFNILAKARMFKGYKVSAVFMVEVFRLLELQHRNVCLVGLASQEKNASYMPSSAGELMLPKNCFARGQKKPTTNTKQKQTNKMDSGTAELCRTFQFFICLEFDLVHLCGFCLRVMNCNKQSDCCFSAAVFKVGIALGKKLPHFTSYSNFKNS